ncbi:MAG TPA: transposase [Streptomyces sp.]
MNSPVPFTGDLVAAPAPAPRSPRFDEAVFAELCSVVFSPLHRSDQRRKGAEYVRGLLSARGRKSIRKIASVVGGPAAGQSLHHFVAGSTWDWDPVRRALANHLVRMAPPQAWVVRPLIIPKEGDRTVGVDRRFVPSLGQVVNAQHAVGVWGASEAVSYPVNWRLYLPEAWVEDAPRRTRAAIPDETEVETLGACVVHACQTVVRDWSLPARPMVLDARDGNLLHVVPRLHAAGTGLLVRVTGTLPVLAVMPRPAGRGAAGPQTVWQVVESVGRMRHPIVREDGSTELAVVIPVRLPPHLGPSSPDADEPALHLLATGRPGGPWPQETWLTNLADARPATLLRLTRLVERVERDFEATGEQVGIRDFAGRSFGGWHRHVTLASAAHAVAVLSRTASHPWDLPGTLRAPVAMRNRGAAPHGSPKDAVPVGFPGRGAVAASRSRADR